MMLENGSLGACLQHLEQRHTHKPKMPLICVGMNHEMRINEQGLPQALVIVLVLLDMVMAG